MFTRLVVLVALALAGCSNDPASSAQWQPCSSDAQCPEDGNGMWNAGDSACVGYCNAVCVGLDEREANEHCVSVLGDGAVCSSSGACALPCVVDGDCPADVSTCVASADGSFCQAR